MWELGTAGRMALPTHVDRVIRFATPEPARDAWAVAVPSSENGADADVVDETGRVRMRLEGYRTIELPGPTDGDALDPIRAALG
jgi:hypothetical protein